MKTPEYSDDTRYDERNAEKTDEFESLCTHCGACCGADDGDPCLNLSVDTKTGLSHCKEYDHRLGTQKTVSGKYFECVPILENIKRGSYHAKCAYRQYYR